MANKANLERVDVDKYEITQSAITKHLQNCLGFPVEVDYTRWTGATPFHSYVRMRVGIRNSDLVVPNSTVGDYVDRVLRENAIDVEFKPDAYEVLKKFMYQDGWWKTIQDPNDKNARQIREQMYLYGLYGDRLAEIYANTKLAFVQPANMWRVYLRTENIIQDMLSDPTTGNVDGQVKIRGVYGTQSFVWDVDVVRGMTLVHNNNMSLEQLFAVQ